jgi:hypothetical protein
VAVFAAQLKAHVMEIRRGTFDVLVDGKGVGSFGLDETFETPAAAGRHTLNADDETRRIFLDICRRHVADDGCVIVQQHSPTWFETARDSEVTREGVIMRMRDVSRPAPNLVSATVEYVAGDRRWTQTFTTMRLDEAELAAALAAAGLRLDRYLTEDRSWFRAIPVIVPG